MKHARSLTAPAATPPPDPGYAIVHKARLWCDRAADLAADPAATLGPVARALDSLWALQKDLADHRLRKVRPLKVVIKHEEAIFRPSEDAIKALRQKLSARAVMLAPRPAPQEDLVLDDGDDGAQSVPLLPPASCAIETRLQVIEIDRAQLDLEALRPFLTDHALRNAVRKHLCETGAAPLRGAVNGALPVSAMPACPVLTEASACQTDRQTNKRGATSAPGRRGPPLQSRDRGYLPF